MSKTTPTVVGALNGLAASLHAVRWKLICMPFSLLLWLVHATSTPRDGGIVDDILRLKPADFSTMQSLFKLWHKEEDDDSSLIVERLIELICRLPKTSPRQRQVTDFLMYLICNYPARRYRRGLAITHFGVMPEASLVFDLIMARDEKQRNHPSHISSMLIYLITIIKHDLSTAFAEAPEDRAYSSQLNLSSLYGCGQEEQASMRQFENGLLKVDCFASKNILLEPPGVGVFLVMFNRFHNYVARQLAIINEFDRFAEPASSLGNSIKATAQAKRDEDLFQIARRVTCGLYVNIICNDYLHTILNLNRTDSTLTLVQATRSQVRSSQTILRGPDRFFGLESGLIYRWNSTLSHRDTTAIGTKLKGMLNGQDPVGASPREMSTAIGTFNATIPNDPQRRISCNLRRGTDGSLSSSSLVTELSACISDTAGTFGPNRIPACVRAFEIEAITKARKEYVPTLNQYRAYLGLTQHKTFEDINPDPKVAQNLHGLYGHPDAVELYPGLVAERTKDVTIPGSGLGAGMTSSYAFLGDLVRLLWDKCSYMHPANLTGWGLKEIMPDRDVDQGCVMHRLILRAFPDHFKPDSVFAHFPFVVPEENRRILSKLGKDVEYSFDPPTQQPRPKIIASTQEVNAVLKSTNLSTRSIVRKPKAPYYQSTFDYVNRLLHHKKILSPTTGDYEIDLVRDVSEPAFTLLFASMLELPLAESSAKGSMTEWQLLEALCTIHAAAMNQYLVSDVSLKRKSKHAIEMIRSYYLKSRQGPVNNSLFDRCFGNLQHSGDVDHSMCPQIKDLACQVMTMHHLVIEAIAYYMDDGTKHLPGLQSLIIRSKGFEIRDQILRYLLEGFVLPWLSNMSSAEPWRRPPL